MAVQLFPKQTAAHLPLSTLEGAELIISGCGLGSQGLTLGNCLDTNSDLSGIIYRSRCLRTEISQDIEK